jgi:hypothetical protein
MLVQNGTYGAVAREARVYEKDNGNLVVCFNFQLGSEADEKFIRGFATLAKADGTINTKAIDNLKQVFGWDGHDPFWLTEQDLSGIAVDLVIENETMEDGKTYSRVKWINTPGGNSAAMPASADRNSILTRYGAKFRALAGGTPVKPVAKPAVSPVGAPPKVATTPLLPGIPAPRKVVPLPSSAPVSSAEQCWQFLCDKTHGVEQVAIERLWFDTIASLFPKKEQGDFSPEDWGKVQAKLEDDIPY